MKAISNIGRIAVWTIIVGGCLPGLASPMDACWKASFTITPITTQTLIEDDEEGSRYFSFETLTYGIKNDEQDYFIKINETELNVEKFHYLHKMASTSNITIRKNDLNMLQGEAGKIRQNAKTYYCLTLPMSGLGASGRFAQYKVVLTIPQTAKYDADVIGMIGSNHSK